MGVTGIVLILTMAGMVGTGFGATLPRTVRLEKTIAQVPAGSRRVSALAPATTLHLSIALKSRNAQALNRYAQAVSTPSSPEYRDYLSVGQFARRFGATAAVQRSVLASLRSHGLTPGALSANGLSVPVTATAANVATAFSVSLSRYLTPVLGSRLAMRAAYAANRAPALDASIAPDVQSVIGLSDLATPQPLLVPAKRTAVRRSHAAAPAEEHPHTTAAAPCAAAQQAASSQGAYTDDQIDGAFGLNAAYAGGDFGAGQTIAVYELEPNLTTDISSFQSCFGTSTTVNYTSVDGGAGTGPGAGEAALDIETLIAAAPAATIDVYDGPQTGSSPYDIYNQIISGDTAQVISTSWGACEKEVPTTDLQAESTLFQEAATQGQSLFAAAGDDGSEDCDAGDFDTTDLTVDDPGSQPYVTSVGGTRLVTTAPSETAWNDTEGAGGGGISSVWSMPSYQSTASPSLNVINPQSSGAPCAAAAGDCREVPDVSADADPETGYEIYYSDSEGDPPWIAEGGTSAAAPFWAGYMALVNASPSCGGRAVGFANPALYAAADSAYGADFSDVTSGDNDFTAANNGVYAAGAGYDMATGLGSPLGAPLAATLCSEFVSVSNPGTQAEILGSAIAPVQVSASGGAGQGFTFTAANLPAGLVISATGLITGTPTAITAAPVAVKVTATSTGGFLGTAVFSISVVPTSVTVADPGAEKATLKKKIVPLQITATDSGPSETLTYSAVKLPFGLSISAGGLISGTPKKTGAYHVTVTGKDLTGTAASTSFIFTVAAAKKKVVTPKFTAHLGVAGVAGAARYHKISESATEGTGKPIRELAITLPKAITIAKRVKGHSRHTFHRGRFLGARLSTHEIILTFTGATKLSYSLSGALIRYSPALVRDARHHKTKLVAYGRLIRTNGQVTRIKFTLVFK